MKSERSGALKCSDAGTGDLGVLPTQETSPMNHAAAPEANGKTTVLKKASFFFKACRIIVFKLTINWHH